MKNKVAIVYSDYYKDVTNGLLDGFNNSIDTTFDCDEFKVSGSWEIIYKINSLINEYDKFVAIGVIVKGETDHYEFLSSSIANLSTPTPNANPWESVLYPTCLKTLGSTIPHPRISSHSPSFQLTKTSADGSVNGKK